MRLIDSNCDFEVDSVFVKENQESENRELFLRHIIFYKALLPIKSCQGVIGSELGRMRMAG